MKGNHHKIKECKTGHKGQNKTDQTRFRSLSASGLVTSSLKFCCFLVCVCIVYQKILLCFQKDRCVTGISVVF